MEKWKEKFSCDSLAVHFTVTDLCSAAFSVPVGPLVVPTYIVSIRHSLSLPLCLHLLYVTHGQPFLQKSTKDLLFSGSSHSLCLRGSVKPLRHVADCGLKASPHTICYLVFVFNLRQRTFSDGHTDVIKKFSAPRNKKVLLSFLDLVNNYHQWIFDSSYDHILYPACAQNAPEDIEFTPEMKPIFSPLKASLCSDPGLGLPTYSLP